MIILGAFVAMYARVGEEQNQYVLISGIVLLMIGVYRIAKTIPSKNESSDDNNLSDES
jgi:hypothetical membrane protein